MIKLIVDSTFALEKNYAEEKDIEVVSLKLTLDDKTTDEGFSDSWGDFYSRLKASKGFPITSQPNPQAFMDAINRTYSKDADAEIIILTISQALSGTVNSARIASEEFPGKTIAVIDSENASVCGRIMVEEIVNCIEEGKTFTEITSQIIPALKENLKIDFVPASMEYLKRGGRVGKLSATIASILKIKPIFNFSKGLVSVTRKVLGMGKAISDLVMLLPQKIKKLYVCYIADSSEAEKLEEKLSQKGIKWDGVCDTGPVFGSHVGPGAIGLASLAEYSI